MIDLLHAYMLYDKGEMPLDLNRDNFYYRVFTVGLDAILTGPLPTFCIRLIRRWRSLDYQHVQLQ